jgi:hypothetical protein
MEVTDEVYATAALHTGKDPGIHSGAGWLT